MCARDKWVEGKQEEEKKEVIFNLENSRATSKIMEWVTDQKGADIYEAGRHYECSKRLFFSNLYKKKID